MDARLASLYDTYERQARDLHLSDRDGLVGWAQHNDPDLPETASKSECIDTIMRNSTIGNRIAKLENELYGG